jgi:hypothetical protein
MRLVDGQRYRVCYESFPPGPVIARSHTHPRIRPHDRRRARANRIDDAASQQRKTLTPDFSALQ